MLKSILPKLSPSKIYAAKGFTLIEVMITIAILGVLLSLAAPAFSSLLTSTRLTSEINALTSDISRARNEAAKRGMRVSICVSTTGTGCASSGTTWGSGWIIFEDPNANGALDTGETIIKIAPALATGDTLTTSGFPNAQFVTFQAFGGLAPSTAGSFTLCASGYKTGRKVDVAITGRPLTSRIDTCA